MSNKQLRLRILMPEGVLAILQTEAELHNCSISKAFELLVLRHSAPSNQHDPIKDNTNELLPNS